MRLLETAAYRGPHLFSHEPMIRMQIDLGTLEERPTNTMPGFTANLLALLPGLANHGCSEHVPGGLVHRLEDGTWLGHVAEHVALELQTLAGHAVKRYIRRNDNGQIKSSVEEGKSLSADARQKAKHDAGPGQGDRGDHHAK